MAIDSITHLGDGACVGRIEEFHTILSSDVEVRVTAGDAFDRIVSGCLDVDIAAVGCIL